MISLRSVFSYNRAMAMNQASRATVRPDADKEAFLKQSPDLNVDSRPRAMGESDLRSLLQAEESPGHMDSLAGTSPDGEDGFAEFRARQNAALMNRASVQLAPKKTGERKYKKLFRRAEEQHLAEKAKREADIATGFDELAGSDAGMNDDEAAALTKEHRVASRSGLVHAKNRSLFAGVAGSDAGFSADELEDTQALARRDAIAGWQANRKPAAPAPSGAPSIDGLDSFSTGVALRSAFRNEAAPTGILTGGRKRGGIRWGGGDAETPGERIKHFEYTDPASVVGSEEESTSTQLRPGSGDPAAYSETYPTIDRGTNLRQRAYQLRYMMRDMSSRERSQNTYYQDLTEPKLMMGYSGSEASEEEKEAFYEEGVATRKMQNAALGKRGYSPEQRKGVVRTAAGGSGFLNSFINALGLGRIFGSQRDRTFDAAPNARPRNPRGQSRGWFQRLFGTGRRQARSAP
jgi:hypothetical protein